MTSLADYNNNPGNLKPPGGKANFYKGQIGIDDKGFAIFETKDYGRQALIQDLNAKINRGVNTPEQFIDIYSPAGSENEETGRDNYKIYLAHKLGLKSTGDEFGKEHIEKLADAVTAFEGGTWTDGKKEESSRSAEVQQTAQEPSSDAKSLYGSDVVEDQSLEPDQADRSRKESAALAGLGGAGLGSIYSLKYPAIRLMNRIGLFSDAKLPPNEAAKLVDQIMANKLASEAEPIAKTSSPAKQAESVMRAPTGGENWQRALTGISTPGAEMNKASLDLAKGMKESVGIKGAPGFTGGMITEGGIILDPRDAAALQARQKAAQVQAMRMEELNRIAAEREAAINERFQQTMGRKRLEGDANFRRSLEKSLGANQDVPQKVAQFVTRSAPVRGGLAGLGIGYNLQGASENFKQPGALNTAAGVTNLGGAVLSGLGAIPKLAPVANPAAIATTTGAEIMSDLARGDKQAAAESGLKGLTALLPRTFGPLGALVYSRGLNAEEDEELRRLRERQAMDPNFYSGKLNLPADAWKAP